MNVLPGRSSMPLAKPYTRPSLSKLSTRFGLLALLLASAAVAQFLPGAASAATSGAAAVAGTHRRPATDAAGQR